MALVEVDGSISVRQLSEVSEIRMVGRGRGKRRFCCTRSWRCIIGNGGETASTVGWGGALTFLLGEDVEGRTDNLARGE